MELLTLSGDYGFHIEKMGKKLRLVVTKGGVENVCRQETAKKLLDFTQNADAHLFKGRLQLQKESAVVKIFIKGEKVGEIGNETLKEMVKWGKW